jgi:hypothetical protein
VPEPGDGASIWIRVVRGAFAAAVVLAVAGAIAIATDAPRELGDVAQISAAAAAWMAVWAALEAVERQRRDGVSQAARFRQEIEISERSAAAATRAAEAAVDRLWRDRREQLVRIEAQCRSASDRIDAVLNHQLLASARRYRPARPPKDPLAPALVSVSLVPELQACSASLAAVLPAAGAIEPRHAEVIAGAVIRLQAAAERLARAEPISSAAYTGTGEGAVAESIDPLVDDLVRVATAAADERVRLDRERAPSR